MGCWNKTCGLSNLHITAGTSVYVFMLEKNTYENDRCYATAFWRPTLLPFLSAYNDYGGGENSHGNINYIIDALKKRVVEMDVGENECHDIAVKADALNEELLFEAVHEGRLKIRHLVEEVQVDFTMIRKDVVDHICENWVQQHYVGYGKGTIGYGRAYIEYKHQDLVDLLPDFIDDLMLSENSFDVYRKFEMADYNNILSSHICTRANYRYGTLIRIANMMQQLVIEDKRDEIEKILKDYLLGCFIDSFMEDSRKVWIPGCHEGSQSMEHGPYRILNNAIAEVLDAEKAEFDEYNDTEEE